MVQLHSTQASTSLICFLFLIIFIFKAAQEGHVDAIELLLKRGANIEAKETSIGATPLHIGINLINLFSFFNYFYFLQLLKKVTQIQSSCCLNVEQILKLKRQVVQLHSFQASTSINLFSLINYFYFYKAAGNGHVDTIELLLERGANIEQGNKNNATPLFIGTNLINLYSLIIFIFYSCSRGSRRCNRSVA